MAVEEEDGGGPMGGSRWGGTAAVVRVVLEEAEDSVSSGMRRDFLEKRYLHENIGGSPVTEHECIAATYKHGHTSLQHTF